MVMFAYHEHELKQKINQKLLFCLKFIEIYLYKLIKLC